MPGGVEGLSREVPLGVYVRTESRGGWGGGWNDAVGWGVAHRPRGLHHGAWVVGWVTAVRLLPETKESHPRETQIRSDQISSTDGRGVPVRTGLQQGVTSQPVTPYC